MLSAFPAGFFLGASLILAIGAQNAFVLRQGLRGEHVALVCFACALSDALLIVAGVLGFGALVEQVPWIDPVARFGGAAFLIGYAMLAFRSAWRGGGTLEAADRVAPVVACGPDYLSCTDLAEPACVSGYGCVTGSGLASLCRCSCGFWIGGGDCFVCVLLFARVWRAVVTTGVCPGGGVAGAGCVGWSGDVGDCGGVVAVGVGDSPFGT